MKVKHKLFLALLFLLVVIILVGSISSYYLKLLAEDSSAIMKDNNRTLRYMRQIEESVDEILFLGYTQSDSTEIKEHLKNLENIVGFQLANITEPGELELTEKLGQDIKKLHLISKTLDNPAKVELMRLVNEIKYMTRSIYLTNEATMIRKNEQASSTAKKAILYMGIFGTASVIIGLLFFIGLPIYISRPLETFNQAIKEVVKGNYKVVIPAESKDEFGELANSFNTMATKLDEYEHTNLAKLIKEQKRLNAVINQLDEVVLGLDEDKRVIFANEHCLKLLHLKKPQLIGKYAPDVATIHPLLNNLISELMRGFLPDEEKIYKPLKVVEDGKEKLFAKNVVDVVEKATMEDRKTLIGHVVILTDVTDFAERDKAKTHFMATLSHELKTPVSAIQMSANLLRNARSGELTNGQLELLGTIENNNERIRRMINEILDISKIESGRIDINLSGAVVEDLIDRAIDGVQLFLDDKGLTITKTLTPHLPLIKVDAHKTVWILNNFLTNAIRYAPLGSAIEVQGVLDEGMVRIAVIDQGQGITQENQKKVFQKFTRLSRSESTGTGLGLAISKEFIEAMGGSIGVQSQVGDGSVFWVRCVPFKS